MTLLKDIDNFHKKYGFEKNEKVGIPDDNELVNFRTSFLMEELAEYTNAITKKDAAGALRRISRYSLHCIRNSLVI
jgi:predicted HAD superfamily Cof-like phosphohydrolase